MAADPHGQPLLQTFQKHIEDMRNLVMCKICIKPLYEPFILSCGHSYCYSCLTSWFMGGNGDRRRRQNMKCPDCRAPVALQPSPNYVLRDLVHMFISRTELLPEDETTHEHELAKEEEAVQMTADRNGVGLFKGAFWQQYPGRRDPMYDPHDGVDRCPECNWELEGGRCSHCEWSMYTDDEPFSDDSSDEDGSLPQDADELIFGVERQFPYGRVHLDLGHIHAMTSPTPSFIARFGGDHYGSIGSPSVVTISSDVDDVDPIDQELAGNDSDAESDLPAAMGGRRRRHNYMLGFNRRQHPARHVGHESDIQGTNYNDSEMGDTTTERTSEMGDSDDDDDDESEDESEMDSFVEHDTPTHLPRRPARQGNSIDYPSISISSDDDDESDDRNTNREPSRAPTTTSAVSMTTAESVTTNSGSEESSEDESRRTPVPRSRPSLKRRVILDDSDEENSESDDSNGDESDVTTIPAQSTATRLSHLQNQRARRGNNSIGRTLGNPSLRPNVPHSRGFDNGNGRHHPYPLQTATSRRGMRQAHVTG